MSLGLQITVSSCEVCSLSEEMTPKMIILSARCNYVKMLLFGPNWQSHNPCF